jgi:hypothetical protein
MCTGSGTTAHNPRSGGDPRLEGDPTPRRREPPQPEPVACRAHSHGLEVTHGQGCRSGGDPRPRLPPGVAVPDPCRSGGDPRPSLPPGVTVPTGAGLICKLICLGCCNFWVGLLEFGLGCCNFGIFLGCWNFFAGIFFCLVALFVWLL